MARQRLGSGRPPLAPDSPIPGWLTAMLCLVEGKNEEAEAEMAKTKALMPQVRVEAQPDSELLVYVDGVCQGRAPVAFQFLPGRHLFTVFAARTRATASSTSAVLIPLDAVIHSLPKRSVLPDRSSNSPYHPSCETKSVSDSLE